MERISKVFKLSHQKRLYSKWLKSKSCFLYFSLIRDLMLINDSSVFVNGGCYPSNNNASSIGRVDTLRDPVVHAHHKLESGYSNGHHVSWFNGWRQSVRPVRGQRNEDLVNFVDKTRFESSFNKLEIRIPLKTLPKVLVENVERSKSSNQCLPTICSPRLASFALLVHQGSTMVSPLNRHATIED